MERRDFLRAVCGLPVAGVATFVALAGHKCPWCGRPVARRGQCCTAACLFATCDDLDSRIGDMLARRIAAGVDRDIEHDIMHGTGNGGFTVPHSIATQLFKKIDTCAIVHGDGGAYGRLVPDCIRTQLLSPGASDMSHGIDS